MVVTISYGRCVMGRLAHGLGSVVIDSGTVLSGRWRWWSLWLWLRHVVVMRLRLRLRPVRVGWRWLGIRRGYGCRMFWIGNAWRLTPAIRPAAGRRRLSLLFFDKYGPDTSAFRPVVGTRI
jgi:hypothetical protein